MALALLPGDFDDLNMSMFDDGGEGGGAAGSGDGSSAGPSTKMTQQRQPQASQACVACKRQKRRCDKALPTCGLCRRMGRACDYAEPPPPAAAASSASADELATLQQRLSDLELRINQHAAPGLGTAAGRANSRDPMWLSALNKFPSAVFLDIDCFRWAGLLIPKPSVDIPLPVLQLLSDGAGVQQIAAEYFSTVHLWLPVISKKRMYLGLPLWDSGPDLASVFLAMRLVTSRPADWPSSAGGSAADNPLYLHSKRFLALLETAGTVSVLYLQALLLVAVYEYGHAIYPAAWMTIGACARYADVLGLPSYVDSVGVLGQCGTWTEIEERRRLWWGIYVLDRVVCLGSKRRFAAPEPLEHELLPADDVAWDDGNVGQAHQQSVTTPVSEPAGPFARLCQVSMLVSRALTHCQAVQRSHRIRGSPTIDVATVTALTESLSIMCKAVRADLAASDARAAAAVAEGNAAAHSAELDSYFRLLAPRCLVIGTMVMVLDMYSCPENLRDGPGTSMDCIKTPEEMALQTAAIDGMFKCCHEIRVFGNAMVPVLVSASAAAASSVASSVAAPSSRSSSFPRSPVSGSDAAAASGSRSASADRAPRAGLEHGIDRVSIFALDSLYCALAVFHWLWKEGGDADVERSLNEVVDLLALFVPRWNLAEEYLALQKHHDVTIAMALRAGR